MGKFLSDARIAKGLTLADVAKQLGLSSGQSVWDWENGKGSGIPAESLVRLVKLYGISAEKAYEQLLAFHQSRLEEKVRRKFDEAKSRILGRGR